MHLESSRQECLLDLSGTDIPVCAAFDQIQNGC